MPISFEKAFSIHDDSLLLRSQRSSIIGANIANSDTPNYKARDMDFNAMLKSAQTKQTKGLSLSQTDSRHIPVSAAAGSPHILFRNPLNASLDGNTVDVHAEQSRFAENALNYQSSYTFLNGKIRGLIQALKGE